MTSSNSHWQGFIWRAILERPILRTEIYLSTVLIYKRPAQPWIIMSLSTLMNRNRAKMAKLFCKVLIIWSVPPSISINVSYGIYERILAVYYSSATATTSRWVALNRYIRIEAQWSYHVEWNNVTSCNVTEWCPWPSFLSLKKELPTLSSMFKSPITKDIIF